MNASSESGLWAILISIGSSTAGEVEFGRLTVLKRPFNKQTKIRSGRWLRPACRAAKSCSARGSLSWLGQDSVSGGMPAVDSCSAGASCRSILRWSTTWRTIPPAAKSSPTTETSKPIIIQRIRSNSQSLSDHLPAHESGIRPAAVFFLPSPRPASVNSPGDGLNAQKSCRPDFALPPQS